MLGVNVFQISFFFFFFCNFIYLSLAALDLGCFSRAAFGLRCVGFILLASLAVDGSLGLVG